MVQEESKSLDRACNITEKEHLEIMSREAEQRQNLNAAASLVEKIKMDNTLLSEEVTGCRCYFHSPCTINCTLQSIPICYKLTCLQGKIALDLLRQRQAAVSAMEGVLEEQTGLVSSIEARLAALSRYTRGIYDTNLWLLNYTEMLMVVSAEGHAVKHRAHEYLGPH